VRSAGAGGYTGGEKSAEERGSTHTCEKREEAGARGVLCRSNGKKKGSWRRAQVEVRKKSPERKKAKKGESDLIGKEINWSPLGSKNRGT